MNTEHSISLWIIAAVAVVALLCWLFDTSKYDDHE